MIQSRKLILVLIICLLRKDVEVVGDFITDLSLGGNCEQILQEFSLRLPEFIKCSILRARPFNMCEKCFYTYDSVITTYAKMTSTKDNDSRSCEDVLLNVDRIQVVRQMYNAVINIWGQSRCNSCFIITDDGQGHKTYTLSNDTLTFNQYAEETFKCIENALKRESKKAHKRNDTVCDECENVYCRLNDFYVGLGETSEDLCMDIVDKMNASRIFWSQGLQCVRHNNRVTGMFISSSCVCLAPFLFYFIAWWRATRQEQCIVPQRRLIPQPVRSTVDT